jgi:hypothetical protein
MFAVLLPVRLDPAALHIASALALLILAVSVSSFPRLKWLARLSDHLATRRRVRRLVKERPRVEREASIAIVRRRLRSV